MTALEQLLHHDRVVIIFRGVGPQECLEAAEALHEGGLRWFEVTVNSPEAITAIALLKDKLPVDAAVGAGTVLTPDEARAACDVGASFVVSPNVDTEVIACTHELGMASIPGAFTPTEIVHAYREGADAVKVFPLRPVGASYVRQLRGAFADVPLLVTGGVDADLARQCFDAGADAVGTGLHLLGVDPTGPLDPAAVAAAARRFLSTATPDSQSPGPRMVDP